MREIIRQYMSNSEVSNTGSKFLTNLEEGEIAVV